MVSVNWLAIIVAAIANMAIGFAWFSDAMFGKQWRKLMGVSESSMKPGNDFMVKMMVIGTIGALLMAFVLAHAEVFAGSYLSTSGLILGLSTGFWNWVGFMVPLHLASYLYEKRPVKLITINAGYWLVSMLVMGVIIAVWK